MVLSRADRFMAVQLIFESGFVDDGPVIAVIASAVNRFTQRGCYQLTCMLSLRQRFILVQRLAESVLDDVPDPGWELEPPANMQYSRTHEPSHLAHVAHFMGTVMQRRCHVGCGCWRARRC